MAKKNARKWNRTNTFSRQKSNHDRVGHPVLVYGKSGSYRKYLLFTHKPEKGKENEYEKLKHNIDPKETDGNTFVKKRYYVSHQDSLTVSGKTYRIHSEDAATVKKYKK